MPNAAPMGLIGPKLQLHIAHLGKPHYFFSRTSLNAQTRRRAHSAPYYGIGNLQYGGGPVDVTPKAYLIFWGITGPTDTTHDPDGLATYLTDFFAALPNSSWLNTVTQYYGAYTGPTQYIQNPTATFTGVYYDSTPPSSATYNDADIAAEALKVANLVGYDANTNYIVVSAHGYTINGFGSQFCGYHSGTSTTSSQLLSYTILPYTPDSPSGSSPTGYSCGAKSVTSSMLDGVSIVGGHEEAETITDADAATGWLDSSSPQMEIGDKCAWVNLQNTAFPNGHSYPTQPLWSNASGPKPNPTATPEGACVQSYSASPTPSPSPTPGNVVTNGGFETGHLSPWTTCHSAGRMPLAFIVSRHAHGGKYDAYSGTIANHKEPAGITSVCQRVNVPAHARVIVWVRGISDDKRAGVYQFGRLVNISGTVAKTFFKFNRNDTKWVREEIDLSAYANGQYYLAFGIAGKKNAHGHYIGLYVDDVSLGP